MVAADWYSGALAIEPGGGAGSSIWVIVRPAARAR